MYIHYSWFSFMLQGTHTCRICFSFLYKRTPTLYRYKIKNVRNCLCLFILTAQVRSYSRIKYLYLLWLLCVLLMYIYINDANLMNWTAGFIETQNNLYNNSRTYQFWVINDNTEERVEHSYMHVQQMTKISKVLSEMS